MSSSLNTSSIYSTQIKLSRIETCLSHLRSIITGTCPSGLVSISKGILFNLRFDKVPSDEVIFNASVTLNCPGHLSSIAIQTLWAYGQNQAERSSIFFLSSAPPMIEVKVLDAQSWVGSVEAGASPMLSMVWCKLTIRAQEPIKWRTKQWWRWVLAFDVADISGSFQTPPVAELLISFRCVSSQVVLNTVGYLSFRVRF